MNSAGINYCSLLFFKHFVEDLSQKSQKIAKPQM